MKRNLINISLNRFIKIHFTILLDRDFVDTTASTHGGGILVFIKKHYKAQFIKAPEKEMIF